MRSAWARAFWPGAALAGVAGEKNPSDKIRHPLYSSGRARIPTTASRCSVRAVFDEIDAMPDQAAAGSLTAWRLPSSRL